MTTGMDEPMPTDYERLLAVAERERAPLPLRERIEADRDRLAWRGAARRRLRLAAMLAGVAAVAGATVALVVPAGGGGPTVLEAAGLGAAAAQAAPPSTDPQDEKVLDAAVGGVHFPTWGRKLNWSASGQRSDRLEGRATRTVFYDTASGVELGYTIVDGEALPWPEGARVEQRRGVDVHLVRTGDRAIAAWRVDGHTCVISAPASVPDDRLVELASRANYG